MTVCEDVDVKANNSTLTTGHPGNGMPRFRIAIASASARPSRRLPTPTPEVFPNKGKAKAETSPIRAALLIALKMRSSFFRGSGRRRRMALGWEFLGSASLPLLLEFLPDQSGTCLEKGHPYECGHRPRFTQSCNR